MLFTMQQLHYPLKKYSFKVDNIAMASISDMISTERDLLSQYTDSFNQKQADINQKWQTAMDRIDASTASENDETASLAQLQKQLDELSLSATLDKFKDMKTTLGTKFDSYTAVVTSNNSVATSMFQNLQGTKDLVAEIISVISDLDSNITQINTTIDTYTATKPTLTSAPVPTPTPTPTPTPDSAAPAAPASDATTIV